MKRIIAVFSIAVMVLAMPLSVAADQPAYTETAEWEVLSLVNQERAKENQKPLSVFKQLQTAAELRAAELSVKNEHTRPNGEAWSTALDGISYYTAGENIAAGFQDAQAVVDAWMNSTGHRENILSANYKHMACGYYYKENSYYGTHWTQMFVGGCTTTSVNNVGTAPTFDRDGNLVSTGNMLSVTCDMHGTSYVALKDVSYYCRSNQYGQGTYTVTYDGVMKSLPCTVGYIDVPAGAWYASAVEYVVDEGLMNGMSNAVFAPEESMTRAQLVTVIYRMMDSPAVETEAGFTDVGTRYYTNAVNWAAENGLVEGIGNQKFDPDSPITRAQLATILLRFNQMHNPDVTVVGGLDGFADGDCVPGWAKTAMQWAVADGLIKGIVEGGKTYIDYDGSATRAQVATVLMRYIEN